MKEIRLLKADEIDARVGQVVKNGSACTLLLYKDARVDMTILDETFGAMNWQRKHTRDNANCIISVWDDDKKCWVEKEDTGTESNTEKEKGLASDSFKRAGANWGIGRELYTAPFIYVELTQDDFNKDGKVKTKFKVTDIGYTDRAISSITIEDNKGKQRYSFGKAYKPKTEKKPEPKEEPKEKPKTNVDDLVELCKAYKVMPSEVAAYYKVEYIDDLNNDQIADAMLKLNKKYGGNK
jgi:hypothetical protein